MNTLMHQSAAAHPLQRFTHCPACGSPQFSVANAKAKHCSECGFTYYANPSAATAAFITRQATDPLSGREQTELLVATRGKEPARGTLDLPGGFCDMDETAEQGIAREVEEETGCRPQQVDYLFSLPNLYLYSGMTIHTMDMFYRCLLADGALPRAADDVARLEWVPLCELRPELFGLSSVRQAVARFLTCHAQR